ncbi:hypothetical protein B0H10DRAFT_2244446 [Mycena sp. CBHHK59/15]|nr:hypothetical protein B0H10DRAFT_2244446 [Mycena sp. CBHHK59/15]
MYRPWNKCAVGVSLIPAFSSSPSSASSSAISIALEPTPHPLPAGHAIRVPRVIIFAPMPHPTPLLGIPIVCLCAPVTLSHVLFTLIPPLAGEEDGEEGKEGWEDESELSTSRGHTNGNVEAQPPPLQQHAHTHTGAHALCQLPTRSPLHGATSPHWSPPPPRPHPHPAPTKTVSAQNTRTAHAEGGNVRDRARARCSRHRGSAASA